MQKKLAALFLVLVFTFSTVTLVSCDSDGGTNSASTSFDEKITLTIAGNIQTYTAFETLGASFTKKYPNITVEYEFINNYYTNVLNRMEGEDSIDLFLSGGIQTANVDNAPFKDCALNLLSDSIDLSDTFEPLSQNYRLREDNTIQYSVPLGGEMRGMYVNKTLLKNVGINEVPTNQEELLSACAVLKEKGYIPMHGNPGSSFAQWLIYPWICNQIANSSNPDAARQLVNSHDGAAVRELIKEPYEFLYKLCELGYYDYKKAQTELNLFNTSNADDHARFFFNIVEDKTYGGYLKKDNSAGQIAFMPAPLSYSSVMAQTKTDYNSSIEYVFVPAPIGTNGGFVYLSPTSGIAINKHSKNLDESINFLNFLFTPENNETFCEETNILPNTSNVFQYVSNLYDVPETNISHLGEVTFDWGFYDVASVAAVITSKANKPGTITKNGGTMIELDWYLDKLENGLTTGVLDKSEDKATT